MLRRIATLSAIVLLLVLAVMFTALNQQRFGVDFAMIRFEVSSGLALLIAFSAGLLGGALLALELDRAPAHRARTPARGASARRGATAGAGGFAGHRLTP